MIAPSTFTFRFDLPSDLADRGIAALTEAGFATRRAVSKLSEDGVLVVVECAFEKGSEIRPQMDRAIVVLHVAAITTSEPIARLGHGSPRRIFLDSKPYGDALVMGSNDEEWSLNLNVIAASEGIDRDRLSVDPSDDPFRRFFEGE